MHELAYLETNPLTPIVVNITRIEAGANSNVVPSVACAEGSVRTFSPEARQYILSRMEDSLRSIADASRCNAEFAVTHGFPLTTSDPLLVERARLILEEAFQPGTVVSREPTMGSEDVSHLSDAPMLYIFLGTDPEGKVYPNHNSRFDMDESTFATGCAAEAVMCLSFLIDGLAGPT